MQTTLKPEEEVFSLKQVVLHLAESESLSRAFEDIRKVTPANYHNINQIEQIYDQHRGRYFGSLQAMDEEIAPIREGLEKDYKDLMQYKDYNSVIISYIMDARSIVQTRERQLSKSIEYAGFSAFTALHLINKLKEIYSEEHSEAVKEDLTKKAIEDAARALVSIKATGADISVLEDEVKKMSQLSNERRAEAKAYQLDAQGRQMFVRMVKIYELIVSLNKRLDRFPNYSEIERECGISKEDFPKVIGRLRDEHCIARHGIGGKQKRFEPLKAPSLPDLPPVTPAPAPTPKDEHKREIAISKEIEPKSKEKKPKSSKTEPEGSEIEPSEESNPGEEFGRT
jgi:hypothetical protein